MRLTVFMALAFCLSGAAKAASYRAEWIYHESLEYFNAGKLDRALVGFMDALIEEPDYPQAVKFLRKTGELLLKQENGDMQRNRKDIMQDAKILHEKLPQIKREKDVRLSQWKAEAFYLSTSAALGSLEPVQMWKDYDSLVKSVPVFSDSLSVFDQQTSQLRRQLFASTKISCPKLGTRLEAVRHSSSAIDDALTSLEKEAAFAMRQALADEEKPRSVLLAAKQALSYYLHSLYAESIASWKDVLDYDGKNSEAQFYDGRAKERLEKIRLEELALEDTSALSGYSELTGDESGGSALNVQEAAPEVKEEQPAAPAEPVAEPKPAVPQPDPAALQRRADDLYARGLKYYAAGNSKRAIQLWQGCLKVFPGHQRAARALERAKKELGK